MAVASGLLGFPFVGLQYKNRVKNHIFNTAADQRDRDALPESDIPT